MEETMEKDREELEKVRTEAGNLKVLKSTLEEQLATQNVNESGKGRIV